MNDGARSTSFGWAEHYADENTPWDLGGPHPELSHRLRDGRLAPPYDGATALVPGAGRAHDAIALARRGWTVTAFDVVDELEPIVAPALSKLGGRFLVGDALDVAARGPFDLVWDHTFFCAIDPLARPAWGARAGELVTPGGRYVALVFPVGKPAEDGGPPHGMSADAVRDALGPRFRTVEEGPVERAVARRTWRERWLALERTPLDGPR